MNTSNIKSSLRSTLLLTKFEFKKILFSIRGLISLATFVLIWFLILWYIVRRALVYLLMPEFKQFSTFLLGSSFTTGPFSWKIPEMVVLWVISLFLFPLFSLFVSADQFSSDRARKTLRFLSLRTSRDALFFGRFGSYILIQALLVLFTLLVTLCFVLYRDASLFIPAIGSSLFIFVNIVIVLLPFTAFMAILSLYASSARRATIYAILLLSATLIINNLISDYIPWLSSTLRWIIPGTQLTMMLRTNNFISLTTAVVPLTQMSILLLLGRRYMTRIAL